MITFAPLWETMKRKNISTYKLEHTFGLSKSHIYNLKHNKSITLNTLNHLCNILDCQIADIIEYTKDQEQGQP